MTNSTLFLDAKQSGRFARDVRMFLRGSVVALILWGIFLVIWAHS